MVDKLLGFIDRKSAKNVVVIFPVKSQSAILNLANLASEM